MRNSILLELSKINLDNKTAMTESKHLKINGFQTRIRDLDRDYHEVQKLLQFISSISGMKIPSWPDKFEIIRGIRTNADLQGVLKNYKNFDEFLVKENIFSYALTYNKTLNYTKFEKK